MTRHRRLIFVITVGLAFVAAAGLPYLLSKPPRITAATCIRIQQGMTQQDVETILGGPPGNYDTGRCGIIMDQYGNGVLMNGGRMEEWLGDEGVIQIGFDAHDAVLWKRFVPAGRQWTLIEQWLGRSIW